MNSKTAIVLAMHGMPPSDYPRKELSELRALHAQLDTLKSDGEARKRHDELDRKVRQWPRSRQNDLYFFASQTLATELTQKSGVKVLFGFNEFCAPDLDQALDAAAKEAVDIVVVTPMMIRGGSHSEKDIPEAVSRAQKRNPSAKYRYLWPYPDASIAEFLKGQIEQFSAK